MSDKPKILIGICGTGSSTMVEVIRKLLELDDIVLSDVIILSDDDINIIHPTPTIDAFDIQNYLDLPLGREYDGGDTKRIENPPFKRRDYKKR
ncbi:MAG: hypothetical protein KAS32_03435 [Candidatus Peribacteraceae bacterium]|nr:hypothetical protein [Candidatus Peribacteraceae bacterium]